MTSRSRHQRPGARRASDGGRHRRGDRRPHPPQESRPLLEGTLPVPQRAHSVLHRGPRQGAVSLLRVRRGRRRHPLRAPDRPARVSRSRRGPRRAVRRHDPAERAARPARRPARQTVRGRGRRRALLPGTPRQARQRRGDVSRRARSSEGALAGADARPRPRRLGLDRPSALPRLSRKPAGRGRPAPAPLRRPRARTTASATGCFSWSATSAAARWDSAGAPSRPRASPST